MKLLFYCGHPAQYLFFRESIRQLSANGHQSIILIKTKDILEDLVKSDGFNYMNIQPGERGRSKASIFLGLLKRNFRMLPVILKYKPDILIGGDPSISQLGWLLGKKRFTLTEDDYPVIQSLARLTFPFAQTIVTPVINNVGKWEFKKTGYKGYMKLAYLHPRRFTPDKKIVTKYHIREPYAIIRLARLTAHHDFGVKGLDHSSLGHIIETFEENGIKPYLSAEYELAENYRNYQLDISPVDMHHILAFGSMLVSDSQSMSMEACMLGVPSIRYSSLSGRISVLEELEKKYHLTYGIKPGNDEDLRMKIKELLAIPDLRQEFQSRRQKMLADKIDVTAFMVWFIENYPESIRIMKKDPEYQLRFRDSFSNSHLAI